MQITRDLNTVLPEGKSTKSGAVVNIVEEQVDCISNMNDYDIPPPEQSEVHVDDVADDGLDDVSAHMENHRDSIDQQFKRLQQSHRTLK